MCKSRDILFLEAAVLVLGCGVFALENSLNVNSTIGNISNNGLDVSESSKTVLEDVPDLDQNLITQIPEPGEVSFFSTETEDSFLQLEETSVNSTLNNTTNNTNINEEPVNTTSVIVCNTGKDTRDLPVELVNSTRLISILVTESNITDRRTTADCTLVLFYARYCPFSSMAAPHFNALARAFPDIKLAAVDAMKYHSFNTQYGIVGVPTLMLFHNGRPAAKFNDSEYNLEAFARFISKYTGLQPHDKLFVTSADFGGPVSSIPTKETDYCLIISWSFMLICGLYIFSKSSWWHWISEAIQNTWHEAEAQHEHGD